MGDWKVEGRKSPLGADQSKPMASDKYGGWGEMIKPDLVLGTFGVDPWSSLTRESGFFLRGL